jgi:hypothetical protein
MNAIRPSADQLIEKTGTFQIYVFPRLGQAEQIETKRGKFVTPISGPLWANPPKRKNVALSRRGRKPKGEPGTR